MKESNFIERRKEPRFKIRNYQPLEKQTSMNELLDRYISLPFKKRNFVEKCLKNALEIAEKDVERELKSNIEMSF